MLRALVLLAAIAGVVASPASAAETHPFSVHDMLAMQRISDPQPSPDGKLVAFTLRTTDLEADRGRTDLWLVSIDGGTPQRLTTHVANDWNPRWDPNGRHVWFLSTRSGSSQVWRISIDGGEATQQSGLPLDVETFAVSPDGETLAVAIKVFPHCDVIECTVNELNEREARKATGRIYTELLIRHWDHWKDGRRNHLFTMPTSGEGEPIDVMKGMDTDCPSIPFGGPGEFTFTPDSRGLVFTAKNAPGSEEAWSTNWDLYHVPIDGSKSPRNLTDDNEAWDTHPVFSADGKTLSWLAMREPGYESDRKRIMTRSWPGGGEDREITRGWAHSAGSILWAPDGKTVYTHASYFGQRALFAVDVEAGEVAGEPLYSDGYVRSPSLVGDRILFGRDALDTPVELHTIGVDGRDRRQITKINAPQLRKARMGEFFQFEFEGWNDETVYGYVVKPVDFDPTKNYPVAFLIHGGPQGSFGNDFHYRWNPQAYAGRGYAAVMVDFHGSTGYGQEFKDSIQGDWGGKPLEDLQKGLAHVIEEYEWLDGDRVSALGASYGGYMINWISGQWPDRFRCLVNHDGNLDERFAYYDTEELWFPERDHMGTPWTNPEGYEKHNPVHHVDKWKTPMLVIHGEKDYRVVVTQGIGTFNALQRRGVPSKFLYFPDENHWVLKPHNSILWHETVLDWLDEWTLDPKDE